MPDPMWGVGLVVLAVGFFLGALWALGSEMYFARRRPRRLRGRHEQQALPELESLEASEPLVLPAPPPPEGAEDPYTVTWGGLPLLAPPAEPYTEGEGWSPPGQDDDRPYGHEDWRTP